MESGSLELLASLVAKAVTLAIGCTRCDRGGTPALIRIRIRRRIVVRVRNAVVATDEAVRRIATQSHIMHAFLRMRGYIQLKAC